MLDTKKGVGRCQLNLLILVLVFCTAMPALATPMIEFSPDQSAAGDWSYDGAGTFSFNQEVTVDRGGGDNADVLVGAFVHIPDLVVGGTPGAYTLSGGTILITDSPVANNETVVYLSGTLSAGSLDTIGSIGAGYSGFSILDITGITVDNSIGSPALAGIGTNMDFELVMIGGSGGDFANMIENNLTGGNGFSGAMTVPEPGTVLLLGLGALMSVRSRKNKRLRK